MAGETDEKVTRLMMKASLRNLQETREQKGMNTDTFILPQDSPLIQAMSKAGEEYQQRCKAEGKDHERGPPTMWKFRALLDAIVNEMTSERNMFEQTTKAEIMAYHRELTEMGDTQAHLQVRTCKMSDMYDKNLKRLELSILSLPCREALLQAIRDLEGPKAVQIGKMPNGGMEVALQAQLESSTED